MSKKKTFYIVPAEYLESNEPDLFEDGKQSACKALGAIMIETSLSKLKLRAVVEEAIRNNIKKWPILRLRSRSFRNFMKISRQ